MGQDFNKAVVRIILIIALAAVLWFGIKWLAGVVNDNAGSMDGGASKFEQQVEDQ